MKTVLLSFLFLVCFQMFAEDTIRSSQNINSVWTIENDTLVGLEIQSSLPHKYVVKLRGESGAIVWRKQFSTASFSQTMSLGLLTELNYTFEIYADGALIEQKELDLKKSEVQEVNIIKSEIISLLPKSLAEIVEADKGEVMIAFKNPLLHRMCIVVRGKSGAAVFKTYVRNKESYKGLFSLKHLTAGEYTVELFDGSEKIEELIVIVD
jgi:hypothetical protein